MNILGIFSLPLTEANIGSMLSQNVTKSKQADWKNLAQQDWIRERGNV